MWAWWLFHALLYINSYKDFDDLTISLTIILDELIPRSTINSSRHNGYITCITCNSICVLLYKWRQSAWPIILSTNSCLIHTVKKIINSSASIVHFRTNSTTQNKNPSNCLHHLYTTIKTLACTQQLFIELDPFFNTPFFKTNQQNILNLSNPKHNLSTPDLNALTFFNITN
jgi:hypothetical protein